MQKKDKINIKSEIDKYIDGQLSPEEIDELWSRIIQKEDYYDYLHVAANIKDLEAPEGAVPSHYLKKLVYAGAAVFIICIIAFVLIRMNNNSVEIPVQPIAAIELPFQRGAEAPAELSGHDKTIREAVLLYYNDEFDEAV